MDDIFVYMKQLPRNINEIVTPCHDGYTVYINEALSNEKRIDAYKHALRHINNNDFSNILADEIEAIARNGGYLEGFMNGKYSREDTEDGYEG